MNYSYNQEQIVFLKDRDIVLSIDGTNAAHNAVLSNGIPSFDLLSSQVDKLSTQDNLLSSYISSYVEVSCSNLCAVVSSLIARDLKDVSYLGEVILSTDYSDPEGEGNLTNTLYGLLYSNKKDRTVTLHPGFLYNAVSEYPLSDFVLSDGVAEHDNQIIHANDFILVVNEKKINEITFDDVKLIKDYTKSFSDLSGYSSNLSSDISSLSARLSSEINSLSDSLSNDIDTLSNKLSTEIDNLSANLSIDLSSLSSRLSVDISSLSSRLSTDIDSLSNKLSAEIDTLSTNLSTDLCSLSSRLCAEINNLSDNLSADLGSLSTHLSTEINILSNYISGQVEVSCSNLCAVVSSLINRDLKDVSYLGDVVLSDSYNDPEGEAISKNSLYGLLLTNKNNRERKLHPGFLFHATSEDTQKNFLLSDDVNTVAILHDNDYILVVNEVNSVANVELSDVRFIKDYTKDLTDVSSYSSSLSNTVGTLSTNISSDISSLSSRLSAEIDTLSTNLSTDLCSLSARLSSTVNSISTILSNEISALSISLSTDISCLSIALSTDISSLSSRLSTDINSLSNKLSAEIDTLSTNLSTDISSLSTRLSTEINSLSDSLSADLSNINKEIEDIKDDVRGGVNYKGHIDLDAKTSDDKRKYQDELRLSTIFGIYTGAINIAGEYERNVTLNNGWLYNITTVSPYLVSDDLDSFTLENNDYIIIHKHGAGISCVDVSALTRENIDIIEAVQDDYVRLYQLYQLSNDLSNDIVTLSTNLSIDLSSTNKDVSYLSNEISGTVAVFNKDKQFIGNKLSAVKVTHAEYKSGAQAGTLDPKCIYIIDDYYDSAYGHQIKDVATPTDLSDAANKLYVDGISTTISGDILALSTNLSTDIMNLSTSLSDSVNAEFIHLTGDLSIGTLGLTGNISAVEFATNPVHAKAVKVGPSALTYIDTSHLDSGGDEITYDIAYPEKSGTIALTSDVSNLSTVLTGEINSVSTTLSLDISSTVAVFNKDKQFVGNKLSAVKVTNAEYDAMVDSSTLNDQCIYVIDDGFMSLRGQKIKNLGEPAESSDATTKNYVDGLAENINSNIDELSNSLCATVNNEFVHISGDINVGAIEVTSTISAKSFVVTQDAQNYGAELCAKEITYNDLHDSVNPATYHLAYPTKSGTIALTSDVVDLSNDLTAELSSVSSVISIELSSLVSVYDDNGNYVGNKLSAVKINNEAYAAAAKTYSLDPKCLYVIDDSYDSAFGHRIADVGDPSLSADAANKKYVDGEISSLSSAVDAKFTTTEDLGQLALNVDNLSADVKYLSSDLSTLEQLHYYATLSGIENTTHSHPTEGQYPDNLLIVDHSDIPDEHKQYYLKFKYGSLVLVEVD